MADRGRRTIESEYEEIRGPFIGKPSEFQLKVKMQGLLLEVLLDIRDELRDKRVNQMWGPKL